MKNTERTPVESTKFDIEKFSNAVEKIIEKGSQGTKGVSTRQHIIDIYPKLHQLMEERHFTREQLFAAIQEEYPEICASITEKTFYNYLLAGKKEYMAKLKTEKAGHNQFKKKTAVTPTQSTTTQNININEMESDNFDN